MIAPLWTTQVWWAALIKLISGPCFSLPHPQTILQFPQKPERVHPLKKMRLGVFRLSGRHSVAKEFQAKQQISSWSHGKSQQKSNTTSIFKKWISFCGTHIDPIQPTVNNILAFFVSLFREGVKYSVFQTARAAINNFTSICSGTDFSTHPLIKRFMTGVFAKRPSLPKYTSIWDVNIVLSYINRMENTTLFQLSCKLCMLFLLLTAQRCQTLHLIQTDDIEFKDDTCLLWAKLKDAKLIVFLCVFCFLFCFFFPQKIKGWHHFLEISKPIFWE